MARIVSNRLSGRRDGNPRPPDVRQGGMGTSSIIADGQRCGMRASDPWAIGPRWIARTRVPPAAGRGCGPDRCPTSVPQSPASCGDDGGEGRPDDPPGGRQWPVPHDQDGRGVAGNLSR